MEKKRSAQTWERKSLSSHFFLVHLMANKGFNKKHRARNEEQLKHIRGGSSNPTGGKLDRTWGETRQRYQSKTGNTPKPDKETDNHDSRTN